jgi:hypothetical protein
VATRGIFQGYSLERNKYSKPSLIRINWGEGPSRLVKQKIALKNKKLRTPTNGTFNDVGSTDKHKKFHFSIL